MPRKLILIISIIFLIIGITGFNQDPLFGVFEVDTRHNLLHFITGFFGLLAAASGTGATIWFSRIFGIIYALLAVAGFATTGPQLLDLMEVNDAGDWLHLIAAIMIFIVGFGYWKEHQQ